MTKYERTTITLPVALAKTARLKRPGLNISALTAEALRREIDDSSTEHELREARQEITRLREEVDELRRVLAIIHGLSRVCSEEVQDA